MPKIYHPTIWTGGLSCQLALYTRGFRSARFYHPLLSVRHIYTLIWPNNFLSLTGYWLETISMKLACSYAAKLREMTAAATKTTRICNNVAAMLSETSEDSRVAVVRNKLLDIWHYLKRTGTRSFHRETNRRRTNTSAGLYVTLQHNFVQEGRRNRSKQFTRI